jgi:hypothetical protein
MRTTIDIDDDVLQAAKEMGRREKKTAGQVISELARRALTRPPAGLSDAPQEPLAGDWYVLPGRTGRVVTNEMVNRLIEQMDEEEVQRANELAEGRR